MKKSLVAVFLAFSILLCCCFSAVALMPENKDDISISVDSVFDQDAPVEQIGISVSKLPDKVKYSVGESFSSDGIKVVALLSDGTTSQINDGFSFSGFDSTVAGVKTITVECGDFTDSFSVYVSESVQDDSNTDEIKWNLKFLNDNGDEVTFVESLDTFWISVGLENYKEVFGNMTNNNDDYTASAFNNTLHSFLNVFYYDQDKITFETSGVAMINPYEDLGYDIDFYSSEGRFVYMADANFYNIGIDDLTANNGELFRLKFKNVNTEYNVPASVSFVSFDSSESGLTLLNKPAGEQLGVSHFIDKEVYGYSDVYSLNLGVSKELAVMGAGVTLKTDVVAIECYIKNDIAEKGYTDYFVKFKYNGQEVDVTEYREESVYYVYRLNGIEPDMFTQEVEMCVYATDSSGEETNGASYPYSIAKYCYDMLGYSQDTVLHTLLVDMLNYGTAAQKFTGNSNELANSKLTQEQTALATDIESIVLNDSYKQTGSDLNADVVWDSAWLDLKDSIDVLLKFNLSGLDNTDGLELNITDADGGQKNYSVSEFTAVDDNGTYTVKYEKLNVDQMRTLVTAVFTQNGTQVSKALTYSIESYAAYVMENSADDNLRDLVCYMMAYGDSAYKYNNG